ncbi:MAG: patatin-like phospholipase family protein [Gemmatimonadales bacterium]
MLSIDGGGIRGIIPATVLAEIEETCKAPVATLFDLIVGTSTGGILALGLTAPAEGRRPRNTAKALLDLYSLKAEAIFPGGGPPDWKQKIFGTRDPGDWLRHPGKIMMDSAQKVGSVLGGNKQFAGSARYFGTGLEETLDQQIGDTPLSDALTRVLITSYDVAYGQPVLFTSFKWPSQALIGVSMRVAARATSAGPTYFEPQVLEVGSTQRVLVDGGVFANNPSLIANTLGSVLAADANRPLLLVSLGTGTRNPAQPRTVTQIKTQNWLGTAKGVMEAAMTGTGELADMLLPGLMNLSGGPRRYYRIQTNVGQCNFEMDDSSPGNTQCLGLLAKQVVDSRRSDLLELCGSLAHGADAVPKS